MIEIRAGKRRVEVDPQELQHQAERYVGRRPQVDGLGDVLVEICKFTDRLYSIPLVEAVGFTIWKAPPAPDTMTVYVSMPLKRGDESITEAFKEVSHADGELAKATHN